MSICLNQLDNIALQVQDIVIGIKGSAIGGIFQCKRLSRLIIDEIKDRCQGVIRFNCLSGNFSVQCKILMRDSLCSRDMDALRSNSFIFSRSIRLDRFALAAGHDLTGTGRLRRDDNAAVVLQRNKDRREQEFCLVQGVTSFLRGWGPAKGKSFVFSRSFSFRILFKLHTI